MGRATSRLRGSPSADLRLHNHLLCPSRPTADQLALTDGSHVLRSVVATMSITDGDGPGVLIVPATRRHIVKWRRVGTRRTLAFRYRRLRSGPTPWIRYGLSPSLAVQVSLSLSFSLSLSLSLSLAPEASYADESFKLSSVESTGSISFGGRRIHVSATPRSSIRPLRIRRSYFPLENPEAPSVRACRTSLPARLIVVAAERSWRAPRE